MTSDVPKPLDGFAVSAFALAFFLMVVPIEADVVAGLLLSQRYAESALLAAVCFVTVLIPTLISWRRQRAQPGVWRGRGYLFAATAILIFNGFMTIAIVLHNMKS